MSIKRFLYITTVLTTFVFISPAHATDDATIQKLGGMIERQQQILDQQARELQQMRQELTALRAAQKAAQPVTPAATPVASAPAPQVVAEKKYVEQGDFPGSMRIPGTDVSIKLGGQIKLDAMYTPNQTAGLSEDVFFTRSIQTGSVAKTGRSRLMARDTRLNVDVRSATDLGDLKAYTEFDLFGASGSSTAQSQLNGYDVRLRHAYIQLGHVLAGQTWSTFNDPAAFAETLDFAQVNGESFVRQPQLRYTTDSYNGLTFAVAIENPEGDIADNTAPGIGRRSNSDNIPDVIGNIRMTEDWGHIQTSALYRRLKIKEGIAPPTFSDTANGYGVNVSGRIKTPVINEGDTFRFQANYGDGIGRYINDLQNIGTESFDATVSADNAHIDTIKAYGGYLSYQALFNPKWRSNLTGGYVYVDQPAYQPGSAMQSTAYVAANIIWSPIPKLDVGFEALWGYRSDVDNDDGNATRLITSAKYSF